MIVDDCSEFEKSKMFLYTNEDIKIDLNDWKSKGALSTDEVANLAAAEKYINIPKIPEMVKGIKKRYTIVNTPNYLGTTKRTLFGINLAFEAFPMADNCVILDDDLIFNRDWLKQLQTMYDYEFTKDRIAMTSIFSEIIKQADMPMFIKNDKINGKVVMVSNSFYKDLQRIGIYNTMELTGSGSVYSKLQRLAENLGYVCISSTKSYAQCITERNIVNDDKMIKYVRNFVMPIAWNKKF